MYLSTLPNQLALLVTDAVVPPWSNAYRGEKAGCVTTDESNNDGVKAYRERILCDPALCPNPPPSELPVTNSPLCSVQQGKGTRSIVDHISWYTWNSARLPRPPPSSPCPAAASVATKPGQI